MYYTLLYDIIMTYIYGGATVTPDMQLCASLLATCGSVLVVALPFFVVFWLVKFISTFGARLM